MKSISSLSRAPRQFSLGSRSSSYKAITCVFCETKQFLRPLQYAYYSSLPQPDRISSITRTRVSLDTRSRIQTFTFAKRDKVLNIDVDEAESLIVKFMEGVKLPELAKMFKVNISQIAELALVLLRAPDLADKKIPNFPPTLNRQIAHMLLMACSRAQEPLATLHILNAVWTAQSRGYTSAIFNDLSAAEIREARKHLEHLAYKANDTDAMSLLGLILEREGKPKEAENLYSKAVSLANPSITSTKGSKLGPQMVSPWNAYGTLLSQSRDPQNLEKAKQIFEKGALEADDPLCFYARALLDEERNTHTWLSYMTKAAASGHAPAMYLVGNFYLEQAESAKRNDGILAKALKWLDTKDPRHNAEALGCEWHDLAARAGHKPSMLKMAGWMAERKAYEGAAERLVAVLSRPKGMNEEFPETVQDARQLLKELNESVPEMRDVVAKKMEELTRGHGGQGGTQ
ncbi:hypothetical protein GQ43DRAFT_438077 [Delitschia confertaspora ATCC 74209]|uniref:HCP-like protein n=1 Tax=Delitschia confertaspora ATCC 74209 TaxID=1513339 RepID=A0A9P4JXD4_9PLEO|nr:hypothetical protein GQ43DRAFT_438077 [Delitschia confertaspora ATCC 74209]